MVVLTIVSLTIAAEPSASTCKYLQSYLDNRNILVSIGKWLPSLFFLILFPRSKQAAPCDNMPLFASCHQQLFQAENSLEHSLTFIEVFLRNKYSSIFQRTSKDLPQRPNGSGDRVGIEG